MLLIKLGDQIKHNNRLMTPPNNRHTQRSSQNVHQTEEDPKSTQRQKITRLQSSGKMLLPNLRQPSTRNVQGSSMFLT